jgi:hypothetical protein
MGPTLLSDQKFTENPEWIPIDKGVGTVRLRNFAHEFWEMLLTIVCLKLGPNWKKEMS